MTDTTFSVQVEGLDKLELALKNYPEIAHPVFQQAINRAPDILAKYTVPGVVPYRTGQLIQTFRRDVRDLIARWFPTVRYAPYVEFGTRPHVILPKNGKALYWPGARHPVRMVKHPGSKANPFMERIRDKATGEINATFKEALDVILKKI